jgi:hypothetical protein
VTFDPLAFVQRHGVVLASAKGPVPNVAEAVAGETIRGSWWAHAQGKRIFAALRTLEDSDEVLACRLVDGKKTFVHARLWPALVRCAQRFPRERLAWTRERHTASGKHVRDDRLFPEWVSADVQRAATAWTEDEALHALGEWAR